MSRVIANLILGTSGFLCLGFSMGWLPSVGFLLLAVYIRSASVTKV